MKYNTLINDASVYAACIETPLSPMRLLSDRLHNHVYLKREDLQPVHSFKIRGAFNKISNLSKSQQYAGIIAASAGNHAQGVAYSAKMLSISAHIVMPCTTPRIKVDAVKQYGANVILHGDFYDDAYQHAMSLAKKQTLTFIHPYDDPFVIAGQGTIAKELLKQCDTIDYIFVAVGGGGLISGIAAYIKSVQPDIKVIGVEPSNSDCMTQALKAKKRIVLDQVGIFADGVAVKQVGEIPFELASQYVDDMITVSTDEICAAIKDIFEETRSIAEPAGALATAGLKAYVKRHDLKHRHLIGINCGANINFDRLRHIAERTEIGENKEALFCVSIPETPGSFYAFCQLLGKRNITEFNYRYHTNKIAHIFVGIGLDSTNFNTKEMTALLTHNNYSFVNLTDNDVAKLHIRYMVGGHAPDIQNEKLYRFQFPERPGALRAFLSRLGHRWNITLFHYRNHGAAYGRVLVGIQIPDSDVMAFEALLNQINITYFNETDNPAWRFFLK
jgi:threonine dehydratase